jgi:hypothetical protein
MGPRAGLDAVAKKKIPCPCSSVRKSQQLKTRDLLGNLLVDGKITFEEILKKRGVDCIRLAQDGSCEHGTEPLYERKAKFVNKSKTAKAAFSFNYHSTADGCKELQLLDVLMRHLVVY